MKTKTILNVKKKLIMAIIKELRLFVTTQLVGDEKSCDIKLSEIYFPKRN